MRKASSYYESVLALNKRLRTEHKSAVRIAVLPDALEDEDKLEMLNAGLLEFVVVDDWKAAAWAQVLPKVKVREDLVLRAEGHTGWAVRKGSPQLIEAGTDFFKNFVGKRGSARHGRPNFTSASNRSATTWLARRRSAEATVKLFEKYGAQYSSIPDAGGAGFPGVETRAGRARSQRRDRRDATDARDGQRSWRWGHPPAQPNIHGGAQYMDHLLTRYFPDAKFDESDRPLRLCLLQLRSGQCRPDAKLAAQRRAGPDKWFNM